MISHPRTEPARILADATVDPAQAMNRWILEALDHVASVGIAQMGAEEEAPTALFAHAGAVLFRIAPLTRAAFFLLDPVSADFPMAWCEPAADRGSLAAELEHQIGDGVFAWALQRNHPVIVPAGTAAGSAMLHVLATRSGQIGMFMGLMGERHPFIPDGCQKLVSIVLTSCAWHVRSEQLRAELRRINRGLEVAIEERTAELRQARDAAFRASQAKTEFLANMSHEIRTPMNAVLGTTAMLLESGLTEEQQSLAKVIDRSGRDLLLIINDVLDFSKLEAGKLRVETIPFDLHDTVRGVVDLLRAKAEARQVRLGLKIADDVPVMVVGDPARLRQILTNLLDNALKFTEHGYVLGHVSALSGDLVSFVIRDSGIGIPAEKLATIFEKFTQADTSTTRKFGGTGLGLAICRQLVEMMGGAIGVESRLGEGARFWFTARLGTADPTVPEVEKKPAPMPPVLRGRVLLVEDNAVNREVALAALASLGCTVEVAEDGLAAVSRAAREQYDVILMDCEMPGLDGYEAARAIRAREATSVTTRTGRVPIVALTASALATDRERALRAGMDEHLSKPFTREDLGRNLARWLAPLPSAASTGSSRPDAR